MLTLLLLFELIANDLIIGYGREGEPPPHAAAVVSLQLYFQVVVATIEVLRYTFFWRQHFLNDGTFLLSSEFRRFFVSSANINTCRRGQY